MPSALPAPPQQRTQQQVLDRSGFVSSESFESLTCGAAPRLIGRLRSAADAGQEALKEFAEEVQFAAISRLGGNQGGGVEVAFGRAMGRSFFATADGSTTTADVVLFFTLDPLDIDTKQSTCVRRGSDLESATVMQALYKIEPVTSGGSDGREGAATETSERKRGPTISVAPARLNGDNTVLPKHFVTFHLPSCRRCMLLLISLVENLRVAVNYSTGPLIRNQKSGPA